MLLRNKSNLKKRKEDRVLIRGAVKTDTGRVRLTNEDAFGFFPDTAFYVVADGMGGHAGGEIASSLAVETMHTSLQETEDEDLTPILDPQGETSVGGRRLWIAIEQANAKVLDMSRQNSSLTGMGTTIAAIFFENKGNQANICHVGDSRVYRIRAQNIEQLTEDHSLVQQLVREGKITSQEVKTSPHRHVLVQAVGTSPTIQPAIRIETPQVGDIFILCSDGVHGVVEETEILATITQRTTDFREACEALIALANARGGPDNSTVIILQYENNQ
jgi:protein phosphatase